MLYYVITIFGNIFLLTNCIETTPNEYISLFEKFKNTYHENYTNERSEEEALNNFANNLELVNNLNKNIKHIDSNSTGHLTVYLLNKYADQDTDAIENRFGVKISPYDNMLTDNRTVEQKHKEKLVKDMNLYDLNDVDEIYKEWRQKWGKKNITNKFDSQVHYYRFVKTLVEINKKRAEGQDVMLDENADHVKAPDEFFYG